MIKNIFAPERIGSYYLFEKRILGIDLAKTYVAATLIVAKGKTVTLEKSFVIPLDPGTPTNYDERAIKALHSVVEQIDHFDSLVTSLSSSLVIFKEFKLPFLDHHKIDMVLEFEVEPLLPFPVHDAVIDFIITKQHLQEKSSEIFIAAVQKQHMAHHLSLFEAAGLHPDVTTVDIFALYGMYNLIPSYVDQQGLIALVDVGAYTTNIALISNGQLRLVRALQKGMYTHVKNIGNALALQTHDAMATLDRFGLENNGNSSYTQAAKETFTEFWQEIALTLNAFADRTEHKQGVRHIYLLGEGAEVKGLLPFASNLLGIECELFQAHKLLQSSALHFVTKNGMSPTTVMSLSIALPSPITADFNLRKKEFTVQSSETLFTKQFIVAITLIVLFFVALMQQDFFQTRKLRNQAQEAQNEAIALLKTTFRKIPEEDDDLRSVVDRAESELRKEEKLWFAFANPDRASFLRYLLELTNRINKNELQFSIDRLVITENMITLDAHVKDHNALIALEKDLRQSKLFKSIDGALDQPDFKMKIRLN